MDFVATQDFITPYVIATGMPHKPTQICKKQFKRGDIITGEIKTVKGKPAFVLHKGMMVIPFSCVEQIVTKKIAFSGADAGIQKDNPQVKLTPVKNTTQKKINFIDTAVLGAVLGFASVILAEKQGWIAQVDSKYRLYGALAGGALGWYLVYRKSNIK